jgi:hypothetical protein
MRKTLIVLASSLAIATLGLAGTADAQGRGHGKAGFSGGSPPGFSHGGKVGWRGASTPPGWSKGRKVGWQGRGMPPGLYGRTATRARADARVPRARARAGVRQRVIIDRR